MLIGLTAVVAAPAAGQTMTISSDTSTSDGDTTVTYTITNTGQNATAGVIDLQNLPDDVRIVSQQSGDGYWKNSSREWFFQSIEPGGTASVTVTLRRETADDDPVRLEAFAVTHEGKQDTVQNSIDVAGPSGDSSLFPLQEVPLVPILVGIIVVLIVVLAIVVVRG